MNKDTKYDEKFIQDLKCYFEEILENSFKCEHGSKSLRQASSYALESGGKRLRPLMLMMSCFTFSNEYKRSENFAIALEMIHNYSLVHDDLPCMDDDDYRRGKLSVHKKFGEAMGVLTGDNLLTKAFEIIFNDIDKELNIDIVKAKVKSGKVLSEKSGFSGMISGQVYDLEENSVSLEDISKMYELKTCSLFEAACFCGALIGGASYEEASILENFGKHFGMAFQIKDDYMDAKQDREKNKKTYLTFSDKDESLLEIERNLNLAKKYIGMLDYNMDFFINLIDKIEEWKL